MIEPYDLIEVTRDIALRVIAEAESIAPGIHNLEDVDREKAVAILAAAAGELPTAGSRRVRSQSRNGTSITYDAYVSPFSPADRGALIALCGGSGLASAGAPSGSFPAPGVVAHEWPELP